MGSGAGEAGLPEQEDQLRRGADREAVGGHGGALRLLDTDLSHEGELSAYLVMLRETLATSEFHTRSGALMRSLVSCIVKP